MIRFFVLGLLSLSLLTDLVHERFPTKLLRWPKSLPERRKAFLDDQPVLGPELPEEGQCSSRTF